MWKNDDNKALMYYNMLKDVKNMNAWLVYDSYDSTIETLDADTKI